MVMLAYEAIACDKDGTLVKHEALTDQARHALDLFRAAGGRLVLATGETLKQLARFRDLHRFDLVIAENGAILYWPRTKQARYLTTHRSQELASTLSSRGLKLDTIGQVILSAKPPNAETVAAAAGDFRPEWVVIRNRDEVMIVPRGINKATGLSAALSELKLQPDEVAGIGDGQNDVCLLEGCGLGVSLVSGDSAVTQVADVVLDSEPGDALVALVDKIVSGEIVRRNRSTPAQFLQ